MSIKTTTQSITVPATDSTPALTMNAPCVMALNSDGYFHAYSKITAHFGSYKVLAYCVTINCHRGYITIDLDNPLHTYYNKFDLPLCHCRVVEYDDSYELEVIPGVYAKALLSQDDDSTIERNAQFAISLAKKLEELLGKVLELLRPQIDEVR